MWVLALTCLAVAAALDPPSGSYFITFSDTIERGMEYKVNVDILNTTDPVDIHAEVQRRWYNSDKDSYVRDNIVSTDQTVTKGRTGTLTLTIPKELDTDYPYYMHIRGSNGLQFETEKSISLEDNAHTIMVQTDKAMYKPGQLVRFRAFAIYPNLRVYSGKFDITLKDPNQNTLRTWIGVESNSGVVAGEFQLADKAVFGDWRFVIETEGMFKQTTKSKSFTVSDYQLPRFAVTVELPPFSLISDTVISGTVKAKYTFGKPVKGMVELHARTSTYTDNCGNPPKYVELAFPIDGEAKFDFPVDDIRRLRSYLEGHDVYIDAIVKEDVTGMKLNGTSSVKFYEFPYKVEILSSSPSTFSPNLPYIAHVQVSQQDGLPVTDLSHDVSIYTCVTYDNMTEDSYRYGVTSFRGTYYLQPQNFTLTPNGIIHVQMDIPFNATEIEIRAHYRKKHDSLTVDKKESQSNNYIQLKLDETTLKSGQKATFRIQHTETVPFMNYEVIARGMVIHNGQIAVPDSKDVTFEVPITTSMAPVAHIIAYYIRDTSEVVAATLVYSVDDIFDNKVAIAFSANESKPRDSIDLIVSADPQSSVNLLAVDQSVRLLKTGNDITTSQVRDALDKYANGKEGTFSPGVPTLTSSSVSPRGIFNDAGLVVITDAWYYSHKDPPTPKPGTYYGPTPYPIGYTPWPGATPYPGPQRYPIGYMPYPGATPYLGPTPYPIGYTPYPGATPYPGGGGGNGQKLKEVETVRQEFPEAWIWSNHTVGADGKVTVNATVPDTITSWIASAFAVNSVSGLGVAPSTATLKVFRPFFVSLNMPSTVLRGEQVVIEATVFNYLPSDVEVVISLPTSSDYVNMVADNTGKTTQENKDQTSTITVKSQKQGSVYFPIIPSSLGSVDIEVSARSALAADAVRRPLYVLSEGIPKEYNIPAFIDLTGSSNFNQKVALSLPAEVVTGSEKVKVKVTGDLIGASLDSLENLLSLPTGCGEQNMMSFAPDVYIADYLTTTKQMTPALEARITNYLEMGYQRELTYQRSDGSFSPFGERDAAGSMWLTAFVTATFHQARPYIYVGNSTLTRALRWIVSRQNLDGSFNEPGLVINKQVTKSGPALTAMVLLALLENSDMSGYGIPDFMYGNVTEKAQAYLEESSKGNSIKDSYTLAIVSYALALAGSQGGDNSFNALNSAAVDKGNLKYWDDTVTNTPNYYTKWTPPHVRAQPINIQTTAYGLLATAARGDLKSCLPITNWLSAQRNPYGGFSTTQDTIVALKALTDYAQRTHTTGFNVQLDISAGSDNQHLSVDDSNALVLQTRALTSFPQEVTLTATGHGVAYAEVDAFFNVEAEIGNPAFDISAVFLDDTINNFRMMTCTKWLKQGSSGMTVMEISIPSGFEPDMTSIGNVAGLKRIERKGRNVVVYFDEIGKTSLCFDMLASRTGKVTNNQDSYITVYDYYQPDNQASIFYQTRSLKKATLCDVCRDCCP